MPVLCKTMETQLQSTWSSSIVVSGGVIVDHLFAFERRCSQRDAYGSQRALHFPRIKSPSIINVTGASAWCRMLNGREHESPKPYLDPLMSRHVTLPTSVRHSPFSLARASVGCVVPLCVLLLPLRSYGVNAASAHRPKLYTRPYVTPCPSRRPFGYHCGRVYLWSCECGNGQFPEYC